MALSGSYDFSQNRNSIILDALQLAGIIDYSEQADVDAEIITSASRVMNRMFKAWEADGLQVWKQEHVTLLLEKSKSSYDLGPSGDHWTASYTETAMRVAGASLDTTIECDSTTGMSASDYVGVVLDDDTIHWTTVASVTDGDTFELTSALTGAAAIDNAIYFYTSKAQRPNRIVECVRRNSSNSDISLFIGSREEYWNLSDKTSTGTPSQIFYDQSLTNGKLYVYSVPDDSTDSLEMIVSYPFQDMDSSTDNIDFPNYWYEAVIDGLAYRLGLEYRVPRDIRMELKANAIRSKEEAMNYDVEGVSIFFQPDRRM